MQEQAQYVEHPEYKSDEPVLTVQAYQKPNDTQTYYRLLNIKNELIAESIPNLYVARMMAIAERLKEHMWEFGYDYAFSLCERTGCPDYDLLAFRESFYADTEGIRAAALRVHDALELLEYADAGWDESLREKVVAGKPS